MTSNIYTTGEFIFLSFHKTVPTTWYPTNQSIKTHKNYHITYSKYVDWVASNIWSLYKYNYYIATLCRVWPNNFHSSV